MGYCANRLKHALLVFPAAVPTTESDERCLGLLANEPKSVTANLQLISTVSLVFRHATSASLESVRIAVVVSNAVKMQHPTPI